MDYFDEESSQHGTIAKSKAKKPNRDRNMSEVKEHIKPIITIKQAEVIQAE
jgi:hypothetical protein